MDRIKQQAPNNILKIEEHPNFQLHIANGQLLKPLATVRLKFENGDIKFAEHFVAMKKLTGWIIGLNFMGNNSVVIDTAHGLVYFPHLTVQVETASSETTAKSQSFLTDNNLTRPPRTTKTITPFVDLPSEWNTTGTMTPLENNTGTASLLIFHSMWTKIDKKLAVRVTKRIGSPYPIRRETQIAEFTVVTAQ